jgi:hypothetical protein
MNDLNRDRALTTADLAARSGPPAAASAGPGPVAWREYEEEPDRRVAEPSGPGAETSPLFSPEESQRFRAEWDAIQIGFVDEPRKSVEKADGLVATVIHRLAEIYAEERGELEAQWDRGDDVSTEDLRIALQRYRSFFGRLLAV